MPIKKNIISFERIAKKYGIDYAIEKSKIKDPTTGLYNYQVYFKSKDKHSMSNAFREYVAEQKAVAMDKRPCIRETLSNFREIIRNLPRPEKIVLKGSRNYEKVFNALNIYLKFYSGFYVDYNNE